MKSWLTPLLLIIAASLATACLIYLTPLKWIAIIEPAPHDVNPTTFYADYKAHPEKYVFYDVRPNSAYESLHAAGSVNMPLQTLYDTRHSLPKHGKTIVLICSGGQASGVGAMYLEHYGYLNVLRIQGGIEEWSLENLPVEGTNATSR